LRRPVARRPAACRVRHCLIAPIAFDGARSHRLRRRPPASMFSVVDPRAATAVLAGASRRKDSNS